MIIYSTSILIISLIYTKSDGVASKAPYNGIIDMKKSEDCLKALVLALVVVCFYAFSPLISLDNNLNV